MTAVVEQDDPDTRPRPLTPAEAYAAVRLLHEHGLAEDPADIPDWLWDAAEGLCPSPLSARLRRGAVDGA